MATYRLNALTIFLLLLAVLLIGYLLNYTWESFMGCGCGGSTKEGFSDYADYANEIVDGYSKDNAKKSMKLYGESNVYFDPVAKNFVRPKDSQTLEIVNRNNESKDHTYSTSTTKIISLGTGGFKSSEHLTSSDITPSESTNVSTLKNNFNTISTTPKPHLLEMEVSGNTLSDSAIVTKAIYYTISGEPLLSNTKLSTYVETPGIKDTTKSNSFIFGRVFDADNYIVPTSPSSATDFIYTESDNSPKYAFLHVPLKTDSGALTNVTFIHVIDINLNQHVQTYYIGGGEIELKSVRTKLISQGRTMSEVSGENEVTLKSLNVSFEDDMKGLPDSDFSVKTTHMQGDKVIKIIASKKESVGSSQFRALIFFDSNGVPKIKDIEMKASGSSSSSGSSGSYNSNDNDDFIKKMREYQELQQSLFGFGQMKSPFYDYDGSPYTDYILKTEVIPPVCPACPSCPNKGVCTNCGGNGGSGSSGSGNNNKNKDSAASLARDFGSGVDDFVRDGADGATNIARDAASGTYQVAKEAVSGTKDIVSDTASGAGNFVQSSASGIGEFTKDAAGGIYGAASDVVGGTVGIGKDIVGGAYDTASNVAGYLAQGIPNYGSPNPNYGGPNGQMGGHYNSYGGGYMNPQQPGTVGQDPYSYFGSIPPKRGVCNYMPRTADFSAFGK